MLCPFFTGLRPWLRPGEVPGLFRVKQVVQERDVVALHIPHLSNLNPVYEKLMGLRFRSLSFLADPAQKRIQVSNSRRQPPKIFDPSSSSQMYLWS